MASHEGIELPQFMRQLDEEMLVLTEGDITHDMLPDKPYWDYWSSGYPPSIVAREVLEEEGWDFDEQDFRRKS